METTDKDEYIIVLDHLAGGHPLDKPAYKKEPVVQGIGERNFVLLECVPKAGVQLQPYDRVYIGEGKREHIHHIIGRIAPDRLSETAKVELKYVIEELINMQAERFIEFFNRSQPLTTRLHQLELLPGVGKKHMWAIIEERKIKPFESFDDLKNRVKLLPDPIKIITKRIISELQEDEKYYAFVTPQVTNPRQRF